MRTVRGLATALALSVVLGTAVAGCGDDERTQPEPRPRPEPRPERRPRPELGAAVQQSTLYELEHGLRLALTGHAEAERHLTSLQLRSPLFEPEPPEERDILLRAGNAIVTVGIPYGEPRCDVDADADARSDGGAELVAEVDGRERTIEIEEQPSGLLATLHDRECAAAEVFDDIDLSFRGGWEHTADRTVETDIELGQRHDGVTAAVERLQGNVIFTLAVEGEPEPVLEVSDDQPTSGVHVTIRVDRCDAHGIIEYKRKYKFVAWVRIGDAEPVRVDLVAEGDDQRVLEELLAECLG